MSRHQRRTSRAAGLSDAVALTDEQEREYIAALEKRGKTQIRSELDHGQIPPRFVSLASQWLSEKERESEHEHADVMRRTLDATERQAKAAERANTRSTIAILIAAGSVIVSLLSLFRH
jgi:hypothetical protein